VGAEFFHADRHDEANSRFFAILRTRLKIRRPKWYSGACLRKSMSLEILGFRRGILGHYSESVVTI
jgi:hypothetical protein